MTTHDHALTAIMTNIPCGVVWDTLAVVLAIACGVCLVISTVLFLSDQGNDKGVWRG